jgi:hypothetical protein
MTEIESLPLGVTLGSVINRQSRDQSVTDDCPRTRRPNAACADHPNSGHDLRTIQTHRPLHSTNRRGPTLDSEKRLACHRTSRIQSHSVGESLLWTVDISREKFSSRDICADVKYRQEALLSAEGFTDKRLSSVRRLPLAPGL